MIASRPRSAAADVIRDAASRLGTARVGRKGRGGFRHARSTRARKRAIAEVDQRREFPDAPMLGEELTPDVALSRDGLTFIADPLDGTTNFLHGYPQYAVSIGVLQRIGARSPESCSTCRAAICSLRRAGGGAHLGTARRSRSSERLDPSRALIGTGFPFKNPELLDGYAKQFVDVSRHTAGIRRAGSAALDLADVACGRFDGFWELVLAPWDVAAGILLVREAGGIVTDIERHRPASLRTAQSWLAIPDIHRWLLDTLARQSDANLTQPQHET